MPLLRMGATVCRIRKIRCGRIAGQSRACPCRGRPGSDPRRPHRGGDRSGRTFQRPRNISRARFEFLNARQEERALDRFMQFLRDEVPQCERVHQRSSEDTRSGSTRSSLRVNKGPSGRVPSNPQSARAAVARILGGRCRRLRSGLKAAVKNRREPQETATSSG